MLVLSRKVGERIHVGDNIVLQVRRIAGNRVTLALDAPRNVRILRGELDGPAREFEVTATEEEHPCESPCTSSIPAAPRATVLHALPMAAAGTSA